MQNCSALGLVCVLLFLSGCTSYSAKFTNNNDEQVDLYLSTLDDKHFVWCELDLAQCRKDFEKWKVTPRGRMIIREYERESTGQTYNTHQVPTAFRTRFVDEKRFAEKLGEQNARQGLSQDSEELGNMVPLYDEKRDAGLAESSVMHRIYGPELP